MDGVVVVFVVYRVIVVAKCEFTISGKMKGQ